MSGYEVDLSTVTYPADMVTTTENEGDTFGSPPDEGISLNIIRFRPFTVDEDDEE